MPTAVLMMIGQIAVMKITKIADGWPSRNAASDSGSQASGGTVRSTWKIGSSPRIAQVDWPTSVPSATPTTAGERIAEGDALQAGGQVPEQALVDAAAVEERIDDQLPGVVEHAWTAAAASRRACGRAAPRSRGSSAMTTTGGTTRGDIASAPCSSRTASGASLRRRAPATLAGRRRHGHRGFGLADGHVHRVGSVESVGGPSRCGGPCVTRLRRA